MDIFNTKKIAALEARIKALEPKAGQYDVQVTVGDAKLPLSLESLNKRLKEVEEEVNGESVAWPNSYFIQLFGPAKPEKLTLRRKVVASATT